MKKIGIFSGTFDPVHAGHITFALKALEDAGLDTVYFVPEAQPRRKEGFTHYAHRVAMLRLALKPYQKLKLLELPDKQFSVAKTLPRLKKRFANSELSMLIGSDMLALLASPETGREWPDSHTLLAQTSLVVGVRSGTEAKTAQEMLDGLQDGGVTVQTERPHVSSRDIRNSLARGKKAAGLLKSLEGYVREHWLYTSVGDK